LLISNSVMPGKPFWTFKWPGLQEVLLTLLFHADLVLKNTGW